jgi:hypothetical protein
LEKLLDSDKFLFWLADAFNQLVYSVDETDHPDDAKQMVANGIQSFNLLSTFDRWKVFHEMIHSLSSGRLGGFKIPYGLRDQYAKFDVLMSSFERFFYKEGFFLESIKIRVKTIQTLLEGLEKGFFIDNRNKAFLSINKALSTEFSKTELDFEEISQLSYAATRLLTDSMDLKKTPLGEEWGNLLLDLVLFNEQIYLSKAEQFRNRSN